MAYHHPSNGSGGGIGDYSGDERESQSGGEERPDSDLHDRPIYLLEHLATFTVSKESGILHPSDGMSRLLKLEQTTGIWSQKMQLCLDYQWVLIMDYETRNIIERFPATLIQEPTAFTSTNTMSLYNNILVFIVSGISGARSEMHIFQSHSVSAVYLVEDLKSLRNGKAIVQQRESFQQHQHQQMSNVVATKSVTTGTAMRARAEYQSHHHQPHQQQNQQRQRNEQYGHMIAGGNGGGNGETDSDLGCLNDETSSTSSDKYVRGITLLNHCFDDIETFIARLQHAAAASTELEKRRLNRKSKKKHPGEGLLTLRTRPPHEKEFIDIFAKFKLSFNLLAKLKAHIHDPNAPELVHFLFTPLALIVEAASDTYYESQLPARVVNPLLTREAINLLINCVTSKETELWRSLGDTWIIPRDQWKEEVGSYHPVFLDGWSPDYLVVDELDSSTAFGSNGHGNKQQQHQHLELQHNSVGHYNGRGGNTVNDGGLSTTITLADEIYDDFEHGISRHMTGNGRGVTANTAAADFCTRSSEISVDSVERGLSGSNGGGGSATLQNPAAMQAIIAGIHNMHTRDATMRNANDVYGKRNGSAGVESGSAQSHAHGGTGSDEQILAAWLDNLQATAAKIVIVTYPRTANNDKELSVVRGEYLEILDDTRKWWKARNLRGQIAHVPHTIVTSYNFSDNENNNTHFYGSQSQQQQQQPSNFRASRHTNIGENSITEQGSTDTTDWIRNKHLGKKGEFRYF